LGNIIPLWRIIISDPFHTNKIPEHYTFVIIIIIISSSSSSSSSIFYHIFRSFYSTTIRYRIRYINGKYAIEESPFSQSTS